jgi:glycolate oxidase FAD binding subunit
MSTLEKLATALQSVVGPEYLRVDAAAEYAVDDILPELVVWPADATQVAAVLRLADEHQATVFPRGGGTNMALGGAPERVDVVLSLQRLQQQLAYEPADMTTTVQAGMRLSALQQALGQQGQRLALDPPGVTTTTVGGVVAANMSGPQRLLYGTARDLLLGIAVCTMDGKRTKAGGRVVKNVTGYDLNKLYTGSLGTLAVLVELTFKLHPLPPGEATLGIGFSAATDMLGMLQTVLQLPLRLNSFEILNAAAVTLLQTQTALALPETAYVLLARVEGSPAVAAKQIQRLEAALQTLPGGRSLVLQHYDEAEQVRLWQHLQELPLLLHAEHPQGITSKISMRIAELPALFQDIATMGAGMPWPMFAHAGNGIAYVCIPPATSGESSSAALLQGLHTLDVCVTRHQGHRVVERAPVAIKRQCEVWGPPGDDFPVMRAIKAAFDPQRRLNPGRFIGGL